MSELSKTKMSRLIKEKVCETDETCMKIIKENKLTSSAAQNVTNNCDYDVENMEGCDHKELNLINTESAFIVNNQMGKLHIDGNDPIQCMSMHSEIRECAGSRSNIHDKREHSTKNKRTDKYNDPLDEQMQCDCKDLRKKNCTKESEVIYEKNILTTSENDNSASENKCVLTHVNRDNDVQAKEIKYFPTLIKSQSLDLYNDDCTFVSIEQKLHNRLLPNINENRSTDNQEPQESRNETSRSETIEHCTAGTDGCQQIIQKPNILTATFKTTESRPIYPNVPYSPYGSPRSVRRRPPLRESRRISIEKSGSFLQLNQYKLMDQIGQGSYGLVKLAYSEEDSTHYAMKILSKKRLERQAALMRRSPKQATSYLDRVYREIAVLKKLDHPNIVKLVEVLDDPSEDSLYMVFELVKKGEVLCIPTDKPLSEERAWSVIRDSLLGLEYLHYQKIIHADLKPGNLLLTECGHVKIADLGVCNEFLGEDATMSNGSTAGTPAFRAPETLVLGQNVYCGRAADIWALGATLFSLVYGSVPFIANSIPLLYEKIKNDDVVFPDTPIISGNMRHCIIRMLEKDASHRITLPQLKIDPWITRNGINPLPTEEENCCLVQVDDDDINSVVRSIPKLDTLILIKTMLKNHSFGNPFFKGISGKTPQPGGSRLQKFIQAGRSNSAPGSYHMALDRQPSTDNVLPSLTEHSPNHRIEDL
ncbi:calcium/calmodulin-dependent protein kinase kinase 1-like [Drosophila albomicans]|uniref:calcium/calmodulin-dependent protein kinase n=1 Tax=Drosophila albomicans TaxID=7291 RepID=A0A9C6SV58_DROAB|nr:calcium/calmodulin-dependent protein kinase kinase 1-like [Drosophila albomicans]